MAGSDDYGVRNRPHLSINVFKDSTAYKFPAREQNRKPLRENYAAHADSLVRQLAAALADAPVSPPETAPAIQGLQPGVIVEVTTIASSTQTKIPSSLDFPAQQIAVLQTQRRDDGTEAALVFVPDNARDFLRDRLEAYGEDPGTDKRPDLDRFEVVETITLPPIAKLFVGEVDFASSTTDWWELWIGGPRAIADRVAALVRSTGLDLHSDRLLFPDTTVLFAHGTSSAIASVADSIRGAISEIRRARGTTGVFIDRNGQGVEPHDWVRDLIDRVTPLSDEAPVVCVLDTGVAAEHPLLRLGLKGAWAYDDAWGADDHAPDGGHGTGVTGLVLYGDLEQHLSSTGAVALTHGAESMKLLPPDGFSPTQPPSYGFVTQGAVALVETNRPGVARSYCLATSDREFSSERPSSWSGALDQIAAGSMPGDLADGQSAADSPKRIILVATGNVHAGKLVDVTESHPIEDPAQSWNAITIGGFTRKEHDPPPYERVVPANHRSPFSRGTRSMPEDLTPIKPEVLFEAGNMVRDASGFCGWHPSVSLISAGADIATQPLVPFWATSAAVAVAGNFVGTLHSALPQCWPETLRALTVDSATWPSPIRSQLIGRGAHWKSATKGQRKKILREVGYGVPDIDRAIRSARNDVTLIAEAEIQPFARGASNRGVYNEMHFYDLPWPSSALEAIENEVVTMKVTLSYFVEPNLTGKAATRPDTYRSYGLRFAMKRRTETDAAFRARINAAQEQGVKGEPESDHWLLGPKAIQAGSLHCDLWRGRAIDLVGHNQIAVYPVGGWWKSHTGQQRTGDKGRYALVVSISAPGQSIDLHAEITNLVEVKELSVATVVAT